MNSSGLGGSWGFEALEPAGAAALVEDNVFVVSGLQEWRARCSSCRSLWRSTPVIRGAPLVDAR